MIKYFTYQFEMSKYQGYRLVSEKSNFDSFKKIKYESFQILYQNSEIIHFKMDSQVIRKLKLSKINEKKLTSNDRRLSLLLSMSEEKEENDGMFTMFNNYSYGISGYGYFDPVKEDNREMKRNLINTSKMYSQKIKQYANKTRFRK